MLTNILILIISTVSTIELCSKDDVVLHYTTRPIWIEGYLIEELGDIIVIEWDVTKNDHIDFVITCKNCVMRDPRMPNFFTIYEGSRGQSYTRLEHGFVFPIDLLLIEDDQGTLRLATTGPLSRDSNMFPILAVEQDGDSMWKMKIILWMNNETTEAELAWLQEGRQAVQSITTIYSEEDIAALKANRNVDAATQVSPLPLLLPALDSTAIPVRETQDDASSADKLVGFIDGEASEKYSAGACLRLLVFGIVLLFLVGLLALFLYRRKHTL